MHFGVHHQNIRCGQCAGISEITHFAIGRSYMFSPEIPCKMLSERKRNRMSRRNRMEYGDYDMKEIAC